jgi:hypothetical protein
MSDFQDEFLFSAPSFHNFDEELQEEEHDDGYVGTRCA